MITETELKEIRHALNKAERPLFFYDDDPDGLASFLLLRRYCGKGKGVVVRSSPVMNVSYTKKIQELSPDVVFILDKPIVEQELIDAAGVPIVWIDHHEPVKVENIRYYNPRKNNDKDSRPTSYWCYQVTKQDMWIAMCGCIGDFQLPDFTDEFIKTYPGLMGHVKDPGEALFTTEAGRLVKVFSFILKGPTSEVNKSVAILTRLDNPYEILNETTSRGKYLYKKYLHINETYDKMLKKARSKAKEDKLLLYTYPSTKLSLTGALSNELFYLYPDKVIVVGREKADNVIISVRSNYFVLPEIIKRCLEGLEGYGGGHEHSCGGNISRKDFKTFIERLKKEIA